MDWVNKITGVITSLLNSHLLQQVLSLTGIYVSALCYNKISVLNNKYLYLLQPLFRRKCLENDDSACSASSDVRSLDGHNNSLENDTIVSATEPVSVVLQQIAGNDTCAECGAPEPDWASLNLGILLCIECSGVHRNLGVHISKVPILLK